MAENDAKIIEFFLPCEVLPKQGDRVGTILTRTGQRFTRHYRDPKVSQNIEWLSELAKEHVPPAPLSGPLRLELRFQYAWRKTEKKRNIALGWLFKDTKPDVDNLVKQFADVLEKLGFMVNDSQIASLRVDKVYTTKPGLHVVLSTLGAECAAVRFGGAR